MHEDGTSEGKLLCKFLNDCDETIAILVAEEGHCLLVDFARRDSVFPTLGRDAWHEAREGLRRTMTGVVFVSRRGPLARTWRSPVSALELGS